MLDCEQSLISVRDNRADEIFGAPVPSLVFRVFRVFATPVFGLSLVCRNQNFSQSIGGFHLMLVHATKEKTVFWEFDSITVQNVSHNLLVFCAPTWPSDYVIENHIMLQRFRITPPIQWCLVLVRTGTPDRRFCKVIERHLFCRTENWFWTQADDVLQNAIRRVILMFFGYLLP